MPTKIIREILKPLILDVILKAALAWQKKAKETSSELDDEIAEFVISAVKELKD